VDTGTRSTSLHIRNRVAGAAQRNSGRLAGRFLATTIAAAVVLGLTPSVADAAPRRPSDSQIQAARVAANGVQDRITALAGQISDAQAAVDDAQATSAIALDEYQATEAAYQASQVRAKATAAAAAQANADLGVAHGEVEDFARRSYMQGSTYSGAAALITAGDPGQFVERAALLEAAGSHRSDVLDTVRVLQQQAQRADAVAKTAVAEADQLKQQATEELASAQAAESNARRQAADLTSRKAQLATQLAAAQSQLRALVGAREAADRIRRATPPAPRPAAPPVGPPVADGNEAPAGAGSSSASATAIAAARRYLGTPYSWGGGGTDGPGVGIAQGANTVGFDCSGLTQYAYGQAGISIPRNSRSQYSALPKVSASNLQAGDLVFWGTNPSNPATIHHVALYLGNGKVIQAPQTGDVVKISNMWWRGYVGAVRPSA
jgi:cell wall-associated NlpC family hydrolase